MSSAQTIDLIMEGGGVKGIGLIGALKVLEGSGYRFHRVAGTSSGAMVAALLAAGYTITELEQIAERIDYTRFTDESLIDTFGIPGKTLSLLFEGGIYEGDYTHNFISQLLAAKGVKTFGDLRLRLNDSDDTSRYKLVVIATDVTRGKMIRLPWDYIDYGLDPDAQEVASAVRASAAMPFYYEPVRIGGSYVVDGGIVSNFPIWLFEKSRHEHNHEWPTFGIKLSAKPEALNVSPLYDTSNTFSYAFAILRTMLDAQDQIHLDDPCTIARTIFVDTADVGSTEFSLSRKQQRLLYDNGKKAAEKFLRNWNFETFLESCTGN